MNNNDIDKPLYAIEDDEKPLYEIEDSLSPRPEEEYCIDDEEEDEDDEDMDEEQPTEESVVSEKKNPSPVRYPLIALAAISEVSKIFYEANVSVSDWAVDGLITFMTFFFGYFSVLLAGGFMLPSKSRDIIKKDIGKQFVMLAMSSLAIFWIFIQIMPMLEPVLVFLPLWTIYLIYKGVRILRVPEEVENSTTGLLCMLIIGIPVLWNWVLTDILLKFAL